MSAWRIMIALAAVMLAAGVVSADEADQGVVCATAGKAPVEQLPPVIAACTWIQHKQPTSADQARVWRYLGIALYRSGELQAAIANFDKALRLTPDDAWALQPRAEANERLGNPQLAIPDYERLLRLQPGTRWKIKLAELGAPPELASRDESAPSQLEATRRPPNQDAAVPGATTNKTLVAQLQKALSELGYPVPVDGAVGDGLRKAITKFAADYSLPTNGEPSPLLLTVAQTELASRQAEKSRPPSPEQRQAELQRQAAEAQHADAQQRAAEEQAALVRRAQASLADLGYQIGDIDGVVGSRTHKALVDMARKLSLPTSRNVDIALVEKLEAAVVNRPTEVAAVEPPRAADPPRTPEKVKPPIIFIPLPQSSVAIAPPDLPLVAPALPPMESKSPQGPPPDMAAKQTREACTHVAASQEKRVALVIGNAAYEHVTKLRNPRADAEDMSNALCEIGFDVVEGYDLNRSAMDDKTIEFARRATTADLAFVYYSGHGIQVEGVNYLVPIDAQFEDRQDLRRLVRLDQLTEDTGAAKKAILVVDACRNDPSQSTSLTRSIGLNSTRTPIATGAGLAQPFLQPGSRTLVAFATKPGTVAYDGKAGERNSPYVEAILRHIKTPGVDVTRVFGMVQDDVAKETGNAQEPTYTASLGGEQVFLVATPPKPTGIALDQLTQGEVRAIQNSLKWIGYWAAPVDGEVSAALVNNVKSIQRMRGDDATGMLTPEQTIALHRQAKYSRPPEALPAFNLFEAAYRAGGGDAEAQRQMAMAADPLFAIINGAPKNREQAVLYYQKSAAQGDQRAMTRLGLLLATSGAPSDQTEARKVLGQAASGGDPVAALRLAELMLDGAEEPTAKDNVIELLKIARASPDTDGYAAARLRMLGVPVT